MVLNKDRWDKDVEFQGKEYRVSSRYEKLPGQEEEVRVIDIFDSEGLYGFVQLENDYGLEEAEAYVRKPGEEGLSETDPQTFKEIYNTLSEYETSWDEELEIDNPIETASTFRR